MGSGLALVDEGRGRRGCPTRCVVGRAAIAATVAVSRVVGSWAARSRVTTMLPGSASVVRAEIAAIEVVIESIAESHASTSVAERAVETSAESGVSATSASCVPTVAVAEVVFARDTFVEDSTVVS
jgi:hypothetical protein